MTANIFFDKRVGVPKTAIDGASAGAEYAFGSACRAGSVEDVREVFSFHFNSGVAIALAGSFLPFGVDTDDFCAVFGEGF